jgi:hypothetical protein
MRLADGESISEIIETAAPPQRGAVLEEDIETGRL